MIYNLRGLFQTKCIQFFKKFVNFKRAFVILMRGNALPNQEYNSHLVCTSWIWGPWHCDWLRSIPIERYMSGILLKIWDISVNL